MLPKFPRKWGKYNIRSRSDMVGIEFEVPSDGLMRRGVVIGFPGDNKTQVIVRQRVSGGHVNITYSVASLTRDTIPIKKVTAKWLASH